MKRLFSQIAACLLAGSFFSSPVQACMGFTGYDLQPLPPEYHTNKVRRGEIHIESFLDKKFAARGWVWAKPPLTINTPKIADHPFSRLYVGSTSRKSIGRYGSFTLYKINWIEVVELFQPEEIAKYLPKPDRWASFFNFNTDYYELGSKMGQIESGHSYIETVAHFTIKAPDSYSTSKSAGSVSGG